MTDTLLVFEGASPVRIAFALVSVGSALWLSLRGLRGAPAARRAWLLGLKAPALLALACLLLEPALEERSLSPIKRRLAILVDASESMDLPVREGLSRAQSVRELLEREAAPLRDLSDRFDLEYYRFADKLEPCAARDAVGRVDGRKTDLLGALVKLGEQTPGRGTSADLAGLVLISDGADTEALAGQTELSPAARSALQALQRPVNTVAVGARTGLVDLAVQVVEIADFAFIRNAVEIGVEIQAHGIEEAQVPLVLSAGGRNLTSQTVAIGPGPPRRVKLKFVPDRVGELVYRVSVPVLPGETITHNNTAAFVIRVIRDKLRVLHLVGRPAWDVRFLRQLLKRDPNVDLVSFFILRTITDSPGVNQDELSLIPFPVDQLFGKELPTFDVVIFQNFNHGPYQVGYFLPELARYVDDGGALLMIGGDLAFGAGGYAGTALETILPVRLRAGGDLRAEEFRPQVARAGRDHPVLGVSDPTVFERLPPLSAFNQAEALVPSALVLLEHPFERSAGERSPILALRQVGRGRSAALLTDGSWRWSFVFAGQSGSLRVYDQLMHNLLQWLTQDPSLEAVSLRSERLHFQPDEPVRLSLRFRGPADGTEATISLLAAESDRVLERRVVRLDEAGRGDLVLPNLSAGAYKARLDVAGPGGGLGSAEEAFVVAGLSRERAMPLPNPRLLERIAALGGGRFAEAEAARLSDLELDTSARFRVESTATRPLIQNAMALALLIGLLVAEWWLRRRFGFA